LTTRMRCMASQVLAPLRLNPRRRPQRQRAEGIVEGIVVDDVGGIALQDDPPRASEIRATAAFSPPNPGRLAKPTNRRKAYVQSGSR
jgi:hypothetical protein